MSNKKVFEISSSTFGRIIESNVPLRLYWNKDGTFDGVEFTVQGLTPEELLLIKEILLQFDYLHRKELDWNIKDIKNV